MSSPIPCVPCCSTVQVTNIPGTSTTGLPGDDGISSYAILSLQMNPVPADGFTTGSIAFSGPGTTPTQWMVVGQVVVMGNNLAPLLVNGGPFTFIVTSVDDAFHATFDRLAAPNDSATLILDAGVLCVPGGYPGVLAAALPTAITDNSTGTASNTIAVGAGQFTLSIYFPAVAITGNVLLYTYTPGFKFKIKRISASVVEAITTGGRAATLTTAIAGNPTTGGIVIMSGAYALGAEQASSAAITGANTGSSVQAITVTASAVTAFAEGGFMLNIQLQNMDTADSIASLADHVNDLITSLT